MQEKDPRANTFNYFRELSDSTPKIIFAYHVEEKRFTFLNRRFEEVWKQSFESVQANPSVLPESVHPEDREYLEKCYQQLLKGIKKEEIEFRIVPEEGEIRWISIHGATLIEEAADRHIIIGMGEDITPVKDHHANLEKFAAKKNSILEILAHDLAGPLGNIKTASSLVAEEIKEYQNPELEKMVKIIRNTSERSVNMIREFVKQEFMASANSSFVKKRVNAVKKVGEAIEQYKNEEEKLGKTMVFTTSSEEIFVEMDDYKFIQAINNLISNSIKFTPDGGTISVSIEDRPGKVLFTVADNGIGIPKKHHEHIFDRFTTARRPGLKGEPSVGLGMSIIKTIVDWHEGEIWMESKENEGTTVFIHLPKEY